MSPGTSDPRERSRTAATTQLLIRSPLQRLLPLPSAETKTTSGASTATVRTFGRVSLIISNRFSRTEYAGSGTTPVILPPARANLSAEPFATGSLVRATMGGRRERLEVANGWGRHRKDRVRAARNGMELRDFDPPMPGGDLTIVGDELAGRHVSSRAVRKRM